MTHLRLRCFSMMAAVTLLNACGSGSDDACVLHPGVACIVAGDGSSGLADDGQQATAASLYLPMDVKQTENAGLVIADFNNHRVVTIREGVIDILTGEGLGIPGGPAEGPASEAGMTHPTGVTELPSGELIVAIWHSYRVIRLDRNQERVEFVTGTGDPGFSGDGGPARDAAIDLPVRVERAPTGIVLLDQGNLRVRHIDDENTIRTIAGSGERGLSGDGGAALEASFDFPQSGGATPAGGMAVSPAGRVFVADTNNHRIRAFEPGGTIETVAGSGVAGVGDDGMAALHTALDSPNDVAFGPDGSLYIADTGNSCIRRLDAAGRLFAVAGKCGERGDGADRQAAVDALLDRPYGIDVDDAGTLFIADTHNHRVRAVGP